MWPERHLPTFPRDDMRTIGQHTGGGELPAARGQRCRPRVPGAALLPGVKAPCLVHLHPFKAVSHGECDWSAGGWQGHRSGSYAVLRNLDFFLWITVETF